MVWHYIFWLNVPIGIVLVPLAWCKLAESKGAQTRLDLRGAILLSVGLFGVVLGLVRGNAHGWTNLSVLGSFALGVEMLSVFARWELRTDAPMLNLRLFKNRCFAAVNVTAMLFSFGMFGSVFFHSQFLQTVQDYTPLGAGLRVLPWTGMPMLLAPVVGLLAQRWGGKPLVVTGLILQAISLVWLAKLLNPTTPYLSMVAAFAVAGLGMTLFFVPVASLVLGSVSKDLEGVASGTNAAFRELGGVFGIALLGVVFSSYGGYASAHDYVSGLRPAMYLGAGAVVIGVVAALLIARRRALDPPGEAALEGTSVLEPRR